MEASQFRIEFYEDSAGDQPVWRWIKEELEPFAASALGLAMNQILQAQGTDVVKTRFGKALGDGLFEFRLDDTVDEILKRCGFKKKRKLAGAPPHRLLLRVFFHVHGNRIVLLLGGYDKGKADGRREQQAQIAIARERLREWRARRTLGRRRSTSRPT